MEGTPPGILITFSCDLWQQLTSATVTSVEPCKIVTHKHTMTSWFQPSVHCCTLLGFQFCAIIHTPLWWVRSLDWTPWRKKPPVQHLNYLESSFFVILIKCNFPHVPLFLITQTVLVTIKLWYFCYKRCL